MQVAIITAHLLLLEYFVHKVSGKVFRPSRSLSERIAVLTELAARYGDYLPKVVIVTQIPDTHGLAQTWTSNGWTVCEQLRSVATISEELSQFASVQVNPGKTEVRIFERKTAVVAAYGFEADFVAMHTTLSHSSRTHAGRC